MLLLNKCRVARLGSCRHCGVTESHPGRRANERLVVHISKESGLINMVQRVKGRKGKIFPLRAMKTWGTGGIAPLILSPDTRWKRLIRFTLKRLMYCRLRVILTGCGFGQRMAVT